MRAYSFGGGVQSTAMLVLAAQGKIPRGPMLFANVGENTEHPDVFEYMEEHTKPFASKHGIELTELRWVDRKGKTRRLLDELYDQPKSVPIPVRMAEGAPGTRRCTERYKITVVARELKRRGATAEEPFELGIGISLDEYQRMRTDTRNPRYTFTYPLIDLEFTRMDAIRIVLNAGLPEPPRSACWFCPLKSMREWNDMARHEPEMFEKAADLEAMLTERRLGMGKDAVFFSSALVPLREAVDTDQMQLGEEGCDTGFCFT